MNKCPLTYRPLAEGLYSEQGLKRLNPRLKHLLPLNYTKDELLSEAAARSGKISLEGVQPKVSAVLSIRNATFELTDSHGVFIIKPQQSLYTQLPENEDLTMRLASIFGIEVPLHGLLYDKEYKLHYFIKRFDREKRNQKFAVEDFAQLSGKNRETKYNSSMERVAEIIEKYCSFPELEKFRLFKLVLFNFFTGNEDMHLKNYSLITVQNIIKLSPSYDLLNTSIAVKNVSEEIALPIRGRKRNLTKKDFIDYFGFERLKLNEKSIHTVLQQIGQSIPIWIQEINNSFLSDDLKEKYILLLQKRADVLKIN